jgi:hypothetical protein
MARTISKQVTSSTANSNSPRWGQERRLQFIDFRLLWGGRVNRSDLMSYFGISQPQASADLTKYQKLAPRNLIYDKQVRAYVPSARFRPRTPTMNAYSFLNAVRQIDGRMLEKEATLVGWLPDYAIVRLPTRPVELDVLRFVLDAIRTNTKLRIVYQSTTRPDPRTRVIGPHAIAFDGIRWHARAYCFEREEFRDFVFSRFGGVEKTGDPGVAPIGDKAWFSNVTVEIQPASHLTIGERRATELDYAMSDGSLKIDVREAMLLYLIQQLPLYGSEGRLRHNHLMIANLPSLRPTLDRLKIEI